MGSWDIRQLCQYVLQ